MQRRQFTLQAAAALGAAGLPIAAFAQAGPRRFAVLSQIGEVLHVVGEVPQTGSRIDRNSRGAMKLSEGGLDRNALVAMREILKKLDPKGDPLLMYVPGVDICGSRGCVSGDRFTPPADLAAELKNAKATHLILLTPHRAEAQLRFERQNVGQGRLEGLGFYVDRVTEVTNSETRATGTGWLGIYAYVRVQLIDVQAGTLAKDEFFIESNTFANVNAATRSVSPWDAVDNEKKIAVLDGLLRTGLERTLPKLVG